MPSIRFLGAAGTVTGSRFLVERGAARVRVDAGRSTAHVPRHLEEIAP
jgi:metallo-beta-lactamase family protein